MNRELRLECIISLPAGVMAIVVASTIVAMAHAPNVGRHHAKMKSAVRIERSHRVQRLARPRVARIAVGQNISRYTRSAENGCRAQFTYCKPGAQHTAAEVVVCRPAKMARDKPACAVVSDGIKQVFCQFAFACEGTLDRSSSRSRRTVVAQAAAGNKVALPDSGHDQNDPLASPAALLKHDARNGDPLEENSKIEATKVVLLRAAQ